MKKMTGWLFAALCLCSVAHGQGGTIFTAYNDFIVAAGEPTANISTIGNSSAGSLINHADGSTIPNIVLTVSGTNGKSDNIGPATPVGDAATHFNGIVGLTGIMTYSATQTLKIELTGLDPLHVYDIILFGDRNNYTDRFTDITISNVKSYSHLHSNGVTVNGDTATAPFGKNTNGDVIFFESVSPLTDTITLETPLGDTTATKYYMAAMKIVARQAIDPFGDEDGDGISNFDETAYGRDPFDPSDALTLDEYYQVNADGSVQYTVHNIGLGFNFVVQSSTHLIYDPWVDVQVLNGGAAAPTPIDFPRQDQPLYLRTVITK